MSTQPITGTILVVDDNEVIRHLLSQLLKEQGHTVLAYANGMAALIALRQHAVDLVILDIMMPMMSGIEVLRRIKAIPTTRDIPVLMISADSETSQIVTCVNLGADDYLVKPFNIVLVHARVRTCLEKHRLRAQELAYQMTLEERVSERTALAEQRAIALHRSEAELRRSEAALRQQTTLLQSILDSMGDGVVVIDTQGDLVHHNPAATEILGPHIVDLLPQSANPTSPFWNRDQQTKYHVHDLPLFHAMGGSTVQEMELFIPPGLAPLDRWLSITARPLRDAQGSLTGAVAVVRDISDAKRAELALRESEERYALAARGANDGLWDWDLRSNQVHFSPRWKAMLGFTEDELTTNPDEWFRRVHPDDIERLTTGLTAHQHRLDPHFEYEYRIQHRDGVYRWMLSRGLAVWDDMGRALRMAGSQTDITVRKQFEEQLLHAALHDSLTGLPNRALFLDRLGQVLNHTHRNPHYRFAVFFLDLDRFKVINDSLGHAVGDQLLITIANRLRECLRPGDTIARLGGDEFTVLLEGVHDAQAAHEIAERIQRTLAAPLHLGEQQVYTTTSIGILLGHSEYHTAAEIVRDADIAMYQAKMKGKARAVVFDPTMHIKVVSHLQMESELRTALEEGQLRVHYQPIVALDTGQIEGVEALVRWQHPQQGLLTPGSFLAVAEESGLIVPISWWVLRESCQQLHTWQQDIPAARSLWVSVNLAPQQLAETDAVTTIRTILQESGLAPTCLKLEITEHTLVEYGEATAQAIAKLRQDGVQLCIDDFGTGYSSLSYLHLLPADVLKIDRSFISRMGERTDRTEIVHTIIALARALGMKAVAEGTETATQADELRRVACDFGQGWLFSKPVDAEALAKLVRTGNSLFTTTAPVVEPLAA